ncbi:TBC1 domain family member 5 homolog A [Hyalella azteca]|uniref:TBC1 domain family member 5 homolog A n=1 Tax=Hyalella azteca TaxID=294128 RepID=A0A8B7N495_HYAAZ|nr:TBC1 domain family member 5 homolog A [Hyalella azteca]
MIAITWCLLVAASLSMVDSRAAGGIEAYFRHIDEKSIAKSGTVLGNMDDENDCGGSLHAAESRSDIVTAETGQLSNEYISLEDLSDFLEARFAENRKTIEEFSDSDQGNWYIVNIDDEDQHPADSFEENLFAAGESKENSNADVFTNKYPDNKKSYKAENHPTDHSNYDSSIFGSSKKYDDYVQFKMHNHEDKHPSKINEDYNTPIYYYNKADNPADNLPAKKRTAYSSSIISNNDRVNAFNRRVYSENTDTKPSATQNSARGRTVARQFDDDGDFPEFDYDASSGNSDGRFENNYDGDYFGSSDADNGANDAYDYDYSNSQGSGDHSFDFSNPAFGFSRHGSLVNPLKV